MDRDTINRIETRIWELQESSRETQANQTLLIYCTVLSWLCSVALMAGMLYFG